MLGVLGYRAGPLLRRGQHHHLGVAVAPGGVGAAHGSLDVGLCGGDALQHEETCNNSR